MPTSSNLHPSLTINHRNFHTGNQIELVAFSLVKFRKLLLNTLNFLLCFISVVLKKLVYLYHVLEPQISGLMSKRSI